jgi:hypothetical protein
LYNIWIIQSDVTRSEGETGNQVTLAIYRVPKKNHDAMVNVQRRLADMLRKHGMLRSELFQVSSTEAFEGFTYIARTMSTNLDDEDEI